MKTNKQARDYLNSLVGKKIDYDRAYGVQCVDMVKVFLDFVYGKRIGALGNGKDVANNCKRLGYTSTKDTGIYVNSTNKSHYGHTFITVKNDKGELYVFEMNGDGKGGGVTKSKLDTKKSRFSGKIISFPIGNLEPPKKAKASTPTLKKANKTVVKDVIAGKYGNGDERVKKLTQAGFDAKSVQNAVNKELKNK